MIKLFRKIRQNLLFENKFSKYLIYAIGEIALVMIGILLALQVNNWNQLKQHKSELSNHFHTLLENIGDDQVNLDSLVEYRKRAAIVSKDALHKFENNTIDNFQQLIDIMIPVAVERRFERHTSGFEQVEESALYQSEKHLLLRRLIVEYNQIIERIVFWEFRFNSFTEAMETELYKNGFSQEVDNIEIDDILSKYQSLGGIFYRCVITSQDIIDKYQQLKVKGNEIRIEINLLQE